MQIHNTFCFEKGLIKSNMLTLLFRTFWGHQRLYDIEIMPVAWLKIQQKQL